MIEVSHTEVFGWQAAIRGMRNPMNSWSKSDSKFTDGTFVMGESDLILAAKLASAGNDHAKFLRMIHVQCDINAPLYWWKEADTYKVGTVANSCSTMHKIHSTPITPDMFSLEHTELCSIGKEYFDELEKLRQKFIDTNNKSYWYALIQLLPDSYMQLRAYDCNYAVLKNMYRSRRHHKLDEWHVFCDWIESLPYSFLITYKGSVSE